MNAPADDDVIRSPANPTLKRIRSLRQRRTRESERAFVVEGIRAVEDAIAAGGRAEVVIVREDAAWRPPDVPDRFPLRRVAPRLFDALSETETPQPLIAVFAVPHLVPESSVAPLYLVVDGVRDPGNLGTLLRSAAAVGVTAAAIAAGSVDPFNGKTVRAGMGAHFRLPILALDSHLQNEIESACPIRVLAESMAEVTYDQVRWREGAALIVGSEAHGPSEDGRMLASCSARIPLANGVESLNAGVAGSIMLFEAARQRRS